MRNAISLGLLFLGGALVSGQEVPDGAKEQDKAVKALLDACAKEGAFEVRGKTPNQVVYLDAKKMRAVVAAHRKHINAQLINGLVALWDRSPAHFKPVAVALLHACGEETKDHHTQGLAAFLGAFADVQAVRLDAGVRGYQRAAEHFAQAKQTEWQAASLNNAGSALHNQGDLEQALLCYRQVLEILQLLYPAEKFKKGHPHLAVTLNNVGSVLQDQGDLEQALKYKRQALEMLQGLYPVEKSTTVHPDLVKILNGVGSALQAQGDLEQALKHHREALELCQRLYPGEKFKNGHPDFALTLNQMGSALQARGDLEQALKYNRRALQMCRALYPGEQFKNGHPDIARSLNNVGFALQARGDPEQALKYFRQVLDMDQRLYRGEKFKNGHANIAGDLNNVGSALQAWGDLEQALKCKREALEMLQRLYPGEKFKKGHPDLARRLHNVGVTLQARGDLEQALKYFRQALDMEQRLYPREKFKKGHHHIAFTLNNVGSVLQDQGDLEQALKYNRQALDMLQRLYPEEKFKKGHPDLANSLNSVGTVLQAQGDTEQALKYKRQALDMLQRLYPKEQFENGHPHLALSLNNVGMALQDQGDTDQALKHYRQALEMCERLYPRETFKNGHAHLAVSLNNVGLALHAKGDLEQALKFLRQALQMYQTLYPGEKYKNGHTDLASGINNVGFVLQARGDVEQALKYKRQALEMLQRLYPKEKYKNGHTDLARGLNNVGFALAVQGRPKQALRYHRQALEMDLLQVKHFGSSASEDRGLNFAASLPLTRDSLLSVAFHIESSAPATYEAIWPGRSAVTRIQERRHLALLAAGSSPKVRKLYDRLLLLRKERTQILLAPLPEDTRFRDERLKKLDEDIEETEKDLLPLLPVLARSEELANSKPTHLQKALPAKTAFIDFLRYLRFEQDSKVRGKKGERRTPSYVAFVLLRDKLVRVDLGTAKPIEEVVSLWRRAVMEADKSALEHARNVRKRVWDKLAPHLEGIDTVYLAPDGHLTQVPWCALPGDKHGTILLEQFTLAVVPHGVFLLDQLTATRNAGNKGKASLLAVGGVKYDEQPKVADLVLAKGDRAATVADKEELKWKYLAGAASELQRIKALASGLDVTALSGAEAGTRRVLLALPKANLAHFATHGFFADAKFRSILQLDEKLFDRSMSTTGEVLQRIGAGARNPLVLSGLVLAGANRKETPDRGILSADDLTRLDLRKLTLAVLSACETGLGEVGGGEGVFGLQRAFHVAGTHNVIASLWKVDDEATAALMVLFYRHLFDEKEPHTPLQALRKAQLAMYHNPARHGTWAKGGRGINVKEIFTGTGKPPADVKPDHKAHLKLWAAFTLSGLGR